MQIYNLFSQKSHKFAKRHLKFCTHAYKTHTEFTKFFHNTSAAYTVTKSSEESLKQLCPAHSTHQQRVYICMYVYAHEERAKMSRVTDFVKGLPLTLACVRLEILFYKYTSACTLVSATSGRSYEMPKRPMACKRKIIRKSG
uniref:Uncharacterized protein n=1 Tax=Bactrocera dorsalis TaxID=27457 RepID=A0A034V917_BACDO